MRVGAPRDVVLNQPVRIQRPQDTKHIHVSVGIKNIVNYTLEGEREKGGGEREV